MQSRRSTHKGAPNNRRTIHVKIRDKMMYRKTAETDRKTSARVTKPHHFPEAGGVAHQFLFFDLEVRLPAVYRKLRDPH